MKQLSDCGRLINITNLKVMVLTRVTINSKTFFFTFTSRGKAGINQLFGLRKMGQMGGGGGGGYQKASLTAWHVRTSKIRGRGTVH